MIPQQKCYIVVIYGWRLSHNMQKDPGGFLLTCDKHLLENEWCHCAKYSASNSWISPFVFMLIPQTRGNNFFWRKNITCWFNKDIVLKRRVLNLSFWFASPDPLTHQSRSNNLQQLLREFMYFTWKLELMMLPWTKLFDWMSFKVNLSVNVWIDRKILWELIS